MTRPFTHLVVFIVILQLLIHVSASPYSVQDFTSLFANPVSDFIKLLSRSNSSEPKSVSGNHAYNTEKGKDVRTGTKMIDVPLNVHKKCPDGSFPDVKGVCRNLW